MYTASIITTTVKCGLSTCSNCLVLRKYKKNAVKLLHVEVYVCYAFLLNAIYFYTTMKEYGNIHLKYCSNNVLFLAKFSAKISKSEGFKLLTP